ncbi:carboxylesterase/lipase family protein [Trinickia diaoshuihuensis]|uniref:carboxylesterase/lipase family protein n=1 Tax=Trinickia diaoshuihuensis TaxID=2292265 RepID=UPI000E280BDE|nr:carboxylesterase family protein [Trinickia diaoshuihuensis]
MNRSFTIRPSSRTFVAASALSLLCSLSLAAATPPALPSPQVQLADGAIAGERAISGAQPLNVFRGIPYAAPPVDSNRWHAPQPAARWSGVREAKQFAPRCMQMDLPGLTFRSDRMSEDCLYLNVWAPVQQPNEAMPVLVYFHGGGFAVGDGSEPRYDGANLAARGIVVVTVNYRLGAFGFMMHPDAAGEGGAGTAGNYGLLDQQAALRWVRENIARFGGNPAQVTIAGETAGAIAVSAHMASPTSRGLFARAIGESGGAFAPNAFWRREKAERVARGFAALAGAESLQALRKLSAEQLQAAMGTYSAPSPSFWPTIDGHFLTDTPAAIFEAGAQAPVPLLVGSNSAESHARTVYGPMEPTEENWSIIMQAVFGNALPEARKFYPGGNAAEIAQSATTLTNDITISHSVWRWMDLHRQTGRAPVYFYLFTHRRPPAVAGYDDSAPATGAPHRSEIVYALSTLDEDRRYPWRKDDRTVARIFSGYIEQFVKTGNPNGRYDRQSNFTKIGRVPDLQAAPDWPAARLGRDGIVRQVIALDTHTIEDPSAERQALVERVMSSRGGK